MDHLTPAQRSYLMSCVRTKDTPLERLVRCELHKRGFRFRKHVKTLPGSPDLVLVKQKLAVFIDGDFWHGYRLPSWEHKLQPFWRAKIQENRRRDQRNFRRLRRLGWRVIRIWQHQIENDCLACVTKVVRAACFQPAPGRAR